jgi:glycosyltransferase involved in cell wall biosynthesis
MSHQLSVVIITKNEESYIEDAIKSAQFADEVLVLDNNSEDKTCLIAKQLGARVETHDWLGYGPQKNIAIKLAINDWVFVLDADERITNELQIEILKVLKHPTSNGYLVSRLNKFFGKDIKTCGLFPDYSLRLFDRTKGEFNNVPVHESVKVRGDTSKLNHYMIHLAYDNVNQFNDKQKLYSKLSQKKKNILKALLSPCWVFFKIYFIKLGFIDGWHGFVIAKVYAKYTFWKYTK